VFVCVYVCVCACVCVCIFVLVSVCCFLGGGGGCATPARECFPSHRVPAPRVSASSTNPSTPCTPAVGWEPSELDWGPPERPHGLALGLRHAAAEGRDGDCGAVHPWLGGPDGRRVRAASCPCPCPGRCSPTTQTPTRAPGHKPPTSGCSLPPAHLGQRHAPCGCASPAAVCPPAARCDAPACGCVQAHPPPFSPNSCVVCVGVRTSGRCMRVPPRMSVLILVLVCACARACVRTCVVDGAAAVVAVAVAVAAR
jgi:hypothetical protein